MVKPRRGAGSRDTVLIGDADELRALLDDQSMSTSGHDEPMIVEEYLVGLPTATGPHFADYLSVESVVSRGVISHLAVTGRFPPAEPFRETGLFIPSDIDLCLTQEVLEVATKAISALEIGIGFLHTEIKLTPSGPKVIEVNGRLGGSVPEMAALALGMNLFELALRVALGERVVFHDLPPTKRRRATCSARIRHSGPAKSWTWRGSTDWASTRASRPSFSTGSRGTTSTGARAVTSTCSRCSASCPTTQACSRSRSSSTRKSWSPMRELACTGMTTDGRAPAR